MEKKLAITLREERSVHAGLFLAEVSFHALGDADKAYNYIP